MGHWPFGLLAKRAAKGSIEAEVRRQAVQPKPVHLFWGYVNIWLYGISWIVPGDYLIYCRICYLVSSLLWCLLIYARLRLRPRLCFPVVAALVLQLWSVFCSVYASFTLARPIGLGRADFYLLEHLVPFFVAAGLAQIDPKARDKLMNMMLVVLGLSCAAAWCQFFKVPGAAQFARLYTYKDIDFWDGTVGLRAVGLTFHPGVLAAEALMGLAIVGSRVIVAVPRRNDILLMFFFSGAVVFSQARAMYVVLVAIWVYFAYGILVKNRTMALTVLGGGLVLIVVAGLFGQNRLGYAFQSSSLSEDSSYQYRAQAVWVQLDPIFPRFAVTGIGPSPGLLLGTGPEDKWVQQGHVMESCYRLMLAMYGIPGLIVYVFALAGSLVISLWQSFNKGIAPERRRWMVSGFAVAASIAIASYTANTVDQYVIVPYAFMVAGLCTYEGRLMERRKAPRELKELPSRAVPALGGGVAQPETGA
jgi:hypothetical protein